ncbi:hypothetical protein M1K46_24225 [Fictibacillus sp. WQ 8-8]|uniref:hypothetical protein n=1 Tax=Fictibacillus sp. WQ 8-8 TaxID=2938788 RepID=UPI00210ABECA|nr:hypothetical protein [Fictibacillus sp. WQ 8-8]MCQ6268684.1 hypothetical protein [Fictibacillus sp. WQ 8-8]
MGAKVPMKIITIDQLKEMLIGRKYKYAQVHHTYQPDHADFDGKNHIDLNRGMEDYHLNVRKWNYIGQHVSLNARWKVCHRS